MHQGNHGSNFPCSVHGDSSPPHLPFPLCRKAPGRATIKAAKISSIFGPSQGILPFLGWLPDRGFSRLAPTAPQGTLHREGSWQRQGTNTARKPRPSGTSSALERECLTGVAGGTADQPTQGTSRGFTAQVFGRTMSLPSHHASTLGDKQKPGTCLAHLCCPVSPLPALDSFFPGLWNSVFCSKQLS